MVINSCLSRGRWRKAFISLIISNSMHLNADKKNRWYQRGVFYFFNFLNTTNKTHRYTISFITANAVHVSGGFSAYHQELKNCTHRIGYMPSLLAATGSVGELDFPLTHANGSSKQAWHIYDAVCTVFELLMIGGETAWNM